MPFERFQLKPGFFPLSWRKSAWSTGGLVLKCPGSKRNVKESCSTRLHEMYPTMECIAQILKKESVKSKKVSITVKFCSFRAMVGRGEVLLIYHVELKSTQTSANPRFCYKFGYPNLEVCLGKCQAASQRCLGKSKVRAVLPWKIQGTQCCLGKSKAHGGAPWKSKPPREQCLSFSLSSR